MTIKSQIAHCKLHIAHSHCIRFNEIRIIYNKLHIYRLFAFTILDENKTSQWSTSVWTWCCKNWPYNLHLHQQRNRGARVTRLRLELYCILQPQSPGRDYEHKNLWRKKAAYLPKWCAIIITYAQGYKKITNQVKSFRLWPMTWKLLWLDFDVAWSASWLDLT